MSQVEEYQTVKVYREEHHHPTEFHILAEDFIDAIYQLNVLSSCVRDTRNIHCQEIGPINNLGLTPWEVIVQVSDKTFKLVIESESAWIAISDIVNILLQLTSLSVEVEISNVI